MPHNDFPIFEKNPELVYLDSACTSLKPKVVIEAEASYYTDLGACGGRSSHRLGRLTSDRIGESREKVAAFVGAKAEELVWTRNTTEALNIVANSLDYSARRKVLTSVMEHHSVLLPLMRLRDEGRIDLNVLGCDREGSVAIESWEKEADRSTALLITHSWNNTTGTGHDVRKLAKLAHDNGALLCIDGAQGVPHHVTDFRRDGADFLCFSGHKMLGPSGIGALIAKKDLMGRMKPLMSGGGTVRTVTLERIVPEDGQERFEAGVQNYSGIIGLAAACDYLRKKGMERIEGHERAIGHEMKKVLEAAGAEIYGPPANNGALYSFCFKGAKPHDVALLLDKDNVAVRSGFFCAQPAMEAIGAKDGAVRASAYIYNEIDDIRRFGEGLEKIRALY